MSRPRPTILCIATYFKGLDFIDEAHRQGSSVYLLTVDKLADKPWPWKAIRDVYYLPVEERGDPCRFMQDMLLGLSHVTRSTWFDRIVPLDDFDLEKAAEVREHFRLPGLNISQTRFFRDKLAMRQGARQANLPVPPFTGLFHDPHVQQFMESVSPPWMLKPRSRAAAMGLRKVHTPEELRASLDQLGDDRSFYLLEQFIPGKVYHVDSIVYRGEVLFAQASQYLNPPFEVAHKGGIFATHTLEYGSPEEQTLLELNEKVLQVLGLQQGISHTEFIRSEDGQFYFLETAARVGGAHIADMIEAARGINLWREWARMETRWEDETYELPPLRKEYAGLIVTLARQEYPDTSAYTDPEIVWRMNDRPFHAGLIVRSSSLERVQELLNSYMKRFYEDFHMALPPIEDPQDLEE